MADNLLDDTLSLEVGKSLACERAVDLQSVDEDGGGDETVGQNVLVKTFLDGLVHDDGMLGLVLDFVEGRESALLFTVVPLSKTADRYRKLTTETIPFPLDHFFFCFFPP